MFLPNLKFKWKMYSQKPLVSVKYITQPRCLPPNKVLIIILAMVMKEPIRLAYFILFLSMVINHFTDNNNRSIVMWCSVF